MNEILPKYVKKYFDKTAYNHWEIAGFENQTFEIIVVIPAIDEYENLKILIESLEKNNREYLNKTLFIFAINNLASSDEYVKEQNKLTLDYFIKYQSNNAAINLAYIDISTPGNEMPEKEGGVGVARKIGMDLALTKFDYEKSSKKIIIALDADCTVDNNYLEMIYTNFYEKNISAGYVNFRHTEDIDEENLKAIICYEIFLRYYVLGLTFANSPYAYHSIGSTMACDAESYIQAGGMNKRKAAEDFYFMEKLSKNNPIIKIDGTSIYPSSRGSWRVPFGTGQRVNRYLSYEMDEYKLYSPKSFELLGKWNLIFFANNAKTGKEYIKSAEALSPILSNFLKSNSFESSWDKILKNTKTNEQIQKQKKLWFDGFRNLKLIHFLRDELYPQENMFEALDLIFEMVGYKKDFERIDLIPSIDIQKQYLKILRKIA